MGFRPVRKAAVVQLLLAGTLWAGTSGATPSAAAEPPAERTRADLVSFTGLANPYDIETDTIGNVYVSDTGNNRVVKLPIGGGAQQTLGFTGLASPTGLVVARNGDVYVSDTGNDRVVKLPANGGAQEIVASGVSDARGLALDAAGNLFIADYGTQAVYKKAAGTNVLVGVGFTGLTNPEGVAVDSAGNVYATDTSPGSVVKLPAGGGPQVTLGFTGLATPNQVVVDGGYVYVGSLGRVDRVPVNGGSQQTLGFKLLTGSRGIAVDPWGNVYANDTGTSQVVKLPNWRGTPTYRVLTWGPRGVAIDALGNIYASDTANGRVAMLPAGGGAETTVGFTGLSSPYGLAVDTSGSVYVIDSDSGAILKRTAGGTQTVLGFSGLSSPTGVAVDSAGNVYASDGETARVVKLPVGGGAQTDMGFTGLSSSNGVAVDGAGNVYVLDGIGNKVLRKPGGGGAQVTYPFTGLNNANAIAVDAEHNIYLTEPGLSSGVTELAADGDSQSTLGFPDLDYPFGLAVDARGTVYAGEAGGSNIVVLTRTEPELRVTTNPAVAADIIVDGVARDAWGLNWVQLPAGSHQVCFGEAAGLTKPGCTNVTLAPGSTNVLQGNYTANGYLRAITSPALPSTVSVNGLPRNDWGMWAEVAPGTYNVCFGEVAGYNPPACRDVVVAAGATATTTGTFTANAAAPGPAGTFGYLRAVTSPAANAMISVDGQWRDNWGLNWVKLPLGSHEVCFGPALNLVAPPCQTVTISNGATTAVTGTYTAKGFLRVSTSPPVHATIYVDGEAANAWGMWAPKTAGTYNVCFGPVLGYIAPPCQTGVNVAAGATTNLTAVYTPT